MSINGGDFKRLSELLLTHEYVFARTMASIPHYYTHRRCWDDRDFVWAVEKIREHGYRKMWGSREFTYFDLNGMQYWTMGDPVDLDGKPNTIILNRAYRNDESPYDSIAEKYDDMFSGEKYREENRAVIEASGYRDGMRVLDIGCGTGMFLDETECGRYTGIDPSRKMCRIARCKHEMAHIVNERFERFYTFERYDLVIALFGSASYIDPDAVERVRWFLNPGGRAFLMFYKDSYRPVTYDMAGKEVGHHRTGEYALPWFEELDMGDRYVAEVLTA